MKAPPYFPLYPRDFVHSCRASRMSPDEIGGLVMVLCQQWDNMGPIASDPRNFAAYTGWDVRVAKRILSRLAEIRKIECSDRGYYSARMADEIAKYCHKVSTSEDRERRKREGEIRRTSPELVPNLSEKFETSSGDLSRKLNQNNEAPTREAPLPDIRYQTSERKQNPLPPEGGVAGQQIDLEEAIRAKVTSDEIEATISARVAEAVAAAVAQVAASVAVSTPETTSLKPDLSARAKRAADKRKHTAAQLADAELAVQAYNAAAIEHGYQECDTIPASRMTRLIKRIAELGGLASFEAGVAAIQTSPFLSGRVKGRDGQPPFKLTIDRLLQTDGNLGDVLASLIEAGRQAADPAKSVAPNGKKWGWWIGSEAAFRAMSDQSWEAGFKKTPPNGIWPWWIFGPAPGDPDCLVPTELVERYGYAEKYRGSIASERSAHSSPSTAARGRSSDERMLHVG